MVAATVEQIIQANVEGIRQRIAAACIRSNRSPDDVTLIGVTKSVDRPTADVLIAAGVRDIAENRVQDALRKFGVRSLYPPLPADTRLHMIGNLQTNKVGDVVGFFASVQSLNRRKLADALQYEARRQDSTVDVLLEVNSGEDPLKQGVPETETNDLLGYVLIHCASIRVRGLMTIAAAGTDPEHARPAFQRLRFLRDRLQIAQPNADLSTLSMGMSNDYEVAIEEGATQVRIGRALFAGLPSPI